MVKKIAIGMIILMFMIWSYNPVLSTENKSMEDALQKAFKASGATIDMININSWAVIQQKFEDMAVMKKWVRDVKDELNLNGDARITEKDYNMFREVKMEYTDDKKRIVVIFQSLKEDISQTYLIVDEYISDFQDIKDKKAIERLYKQYNKKPEISILCEGTFNGQKSYNELEKIKNEIINSIHGSIINDGHYNGFISVTGYSPEIKEYISMGGEKININVALRYSSYDHKTHIYIGSPVITGEY